VNSLLPPATGPLVAFALSLGFIAWLIHARARFALDHPNERSLHATPIPRSGGLGILLGVASAWALTGAPAPLTVWAGMLLLLAVSFLDDLKGMPVHARFSVHLAAAVIVIWPLVGTLGPAGAVFVVLSIAWMTNLYNFMDGSDGLAGGMALIGFCAYGLAAALVGAPGSAMLNFCVAASAAAFLLFNFHPARIFMGDVGSIPLGFLAAALGLDGWARGLWGWWFPFLVFSPFAVDATATLARRALRRERLWQAHREHYYQRLVQMGLGHRGTALAEYALMAAAAGSGLWGIRQPAAIQGLLLAAWALAYPALMLAVDHRWRRFARGRAG
jgi:UDP-GlcNAc:undecaprenyl-phosphate/decaprenyl-phosphate GlcNAc-1-phosphate transferase